ncbi:MAG: type II CRISPR RNA-guided endonuclease Cas9 [Kiloniellaceae bacterium]
MSSVCRLGLDVGANSIGWCLISLDASGNPAGLRDIGVRIFSDGRNPKDKTSLAVARRTARQMRRRRDRYLARRGGLMRALLRHGLMPSDRRERKCLESLNPYEIRARGVDEALTPYEFGRAIFQLNQRRGFRSNRKVDSTDEKETGKIKQGALRLQKEMAASGARTLGEFLWRHHRERKPVRARLHGRGAKAEYDLYPERGMLSAEFDALWRAQAGFHPDLLTDSARADIERILFFQRPLKPVKPGKCTLEPTEERAPHALPLVQAFRIYKELANLRVEVPGEPSRFLNKDERDSVAAELLKKEKLTFVGIRRLLKLPPDAGFNLESAKRKHLDGNKTAAILAKEGLFGPRWHDLSEDEQTAIVERLLDEQDEGRLLNWLQEAWGLSAEAALKVAAARLPDGHGQFGRTALRKIVPVLKREVMREDKAVNEAGYHHSNFRTGEIFDRLPYYGRVLERHVGFGTGEADDTEEKRIGRLANPTVHIGLNQVRKLVNAIIKRHGSPAEVVIEVARELKQGLEKRKEVEREQAENQQKNDERRKKLADLGYADTGENRLKLRLWEELNPENPLDRRCVYTGEPISVSGLFSNEVQIEHILPFSKTLDSSFANKTVSLRRANKVKNNRAPFEAFGHSPPGYDWEDIIARVAGLHKSKQWRFAPDAMERFEERGGFLERHLKDTQYLSRLCREYLSAVCDPNKVWTTPGRLTAMLRGLWGLNSLLSDANLKNRVDHRHHAIDAAVIAVTDRGLLQRVSHAAARAEEKQLGRLLEDMPEPWIGFRDELREAVKRTVVSFKPDHGLAPGLGRRYSQTSGRLHNDTAFGIISGPDKKGLYEVVHRKPLGEFKKAEELDAVRDDALRAELKAAIEIGRSAGQPIKETLQEFSEKTGVRRVRVVERLGVIPIADASGRPYKAYKGDSNQFYEIFERPDGDWGGEVVSTFDANQADFVPGWPSKYTGSRLLMRLCKDDTLSIGENGENRVMRVVKVSPGQIVLAEHFEGGNLKARDATSLDDDPFKYLTRSPDGLRKLGARKVYVDLVGRVFGDGSGR